MAMGSLDLAQIGRIQEQLAEAERPEAPQLTAEELQHYWDRGNKRRPTRPNRAIHTQANIVDGQRRWIAFCQQLPNAPDWKALLKTLSWDNRGLGESFCRYLMRRKKSAIGTLSTIRLYLRQLSAVYWKYTGAELEKRFKDHIVLILKLEIAPKFGLRVEPKHKKVLNPAGFTYLAHFRWVRDKTTFKLGLDRLDDALIRIFLMWTGCRRHELVYGQSKNLHKKVKEEYYGEPDAYTDVDDDADQYIQPRSKICWVCERVDERTTSALKVLCWEDIDLWILRDPLRDGGRDRLAMQILLRFHKGHNKEMVPTWYPFIEEKLPVLCPPSHLLAKALAEGVVDLPGYDRAEPFFNTKISMSAVRIPWKEEFWHKPVFRRTVESIEGPKKSDNALTADAFDHNSSKLGQAAGLPDPFQSYVYRRGNLEILDKHYKPSIRDQGARHRANSTVYQRYYANAMRNAVAQDAGLGRGTESPYLDILNHIGLQYDENAPTGASDEVMRAVGPNSTIRRLERQWEELEASLTVQYGRPTKATGADKEKRVQMQYDLRVARQQHRRKVAEILRKDHFKKRNNDEFDRQLRGLHESQSPLQTVVFCLRERRLLAAILGDLDEDLSEDEIVRRKVDAINAWVDYAWKIEPKESDPLPLPGDIQTPPESSIQPRASQASLALPEPGQRILAPKPWYTSMIHEPVCPPQTALQPLAVVRDSPPHGAGGAVELSPAAMPAEDGTATLLDSRQIARKAVHTCIFCGRGFTRKGTMWNCVERHLARRTNEAVRCPRPECKAMELKLDNEMHFKSHAQKVHNIELRPKITIRLKSSMDPSENVQSTTKIILKPRAEKPMPSRKITLRVNKG